jgi:hypothetical protein
MRRLPRYTTVDAQKQFGEWRDAVEKIVSFTQAGGLQGAMIQLALSLDVLGDILSSLREDDQLLIDGKEMQASRLVRSAPRAIARALDAELDSTVRSIVKIYSGDFSKFPTWLDRVDEWAQACSVFRKKDSKQEL